jgi:uncharacterized membrane protein YphA (DoxX/SURF4 family)
MEIKTILHWISFAVFAYIFGYAGIYKVIKVQNMMEGMASMGFGTTATLIIGYAETTGVIALVMGIFIPVVKPVAVLFLWPFAIGALTTHFSYHHDFAEYRNALLVTVLPLIILATDKHFRVSITANI